MVTDDDTPRQNRGARRILYAIAPDETPVTLPPIKPESISFAENAAALLQIIKREL
jgi:hypothetical protein